MQFYDIFIVFGIVILGIAIQELLLYGQKTPEEKTPLPAPVGPCKLHDWVNCSQHEENDPNAHLVCAACGKVPG